MIIIVYYIICQTIYMLSVFALLMSNTKLLCIIICYTYLGNVMDPSPYLPGFIWLVVLVLAFNIADTDM